MFYVLSLQKAVASILVIDVFNQLRKASLQHASSMSLSRHEPHNYILNNTIRISGPFLWNALDPTINLPKRGGEKSAPSRFS